MKIIFQAVSVFLVISFLALCSADVGASGVRKNETASLANSSTYNAMRAFTQGNYKIDSDEELIAEAIIDIVMNKETDSDIEVYVMGVDREVGMIDLEIHQKINHVNGVQTTAVERRTVIVEKEDV